MSSPLETVIETERLILRAPCQEDFDGFCALMADEEAARYIGGQSGPELVWRGLATHIGSWTLLGFGMFSYIEKSSGQWIGRGGPWSPHGWPGTEIGWGLRREHWGKGYALEAAIAAMDHAVEVLGWTDIIHTIDPANLASQKLAQRLGSSNRGPGRLPPPLADFKVDVWGQSAEQWRANAAGLKAR